MTSYFIVNCLTLPKCYMLIKYARSMHMCIFMMHHCIIIINHIYLCFFCSDSNISPSPLFLNFLWLLYNAFSSALLTVAGGRAGGGFRIWTLVTQLCWYKDNKNPYFNDDNLPEILLNLQIYIRLPATVYMNRLRF